MPTATLPCEPPQDERGKWAWTIRAPPTRIWPCFVWRRRQADCPSAGEWPRPARPSTAGPRTATRSEPVRHHLIDPRTGRPAVTDVIQATVVAESALRAEALAKSAVIAGSVDGFALLERARVRGAVLLMASGEVQALPVTLPLLSR